MPTYILLSSLTPEGSQTLHKDPERLDAVNKEISEFGCKVVTQYAVLGGYDSSRYASERLHSIALDGTRIPISIVYRKDTPRDGSAPLLLYGYGSYGISMPVNFTSNRLSLLDRGVI